MLFRSHDRIAAGLARVPGIALPRRPQGEAYVQSSIQFRVLDREGRAFQAFLERCRARGVFLKWFGSLEPKGYTSLSGQWRYLADPHTPPATYATLQHLCDMRIPLDLPLEACDEIVDVITDALGEG